MIDALERELASIVSPAEFAAGVGLSVDAVEELLSLGALEPGRPLSAWIGSYCAHLRACAGVDDASAI